MQKANPRCKLVLIGNKSDSEEDGNQYVVAGVSRFERIVRCSARSGENVYQILDLDYEGQEKDSL